MKTRKKTASKKHHMKQGSKRIAPPRPEPYLEQRNEQRDPYGGNDKRGPLEEGE